MAVDLTRRTYDLLRLIDSEEPIGSIRLVERMQHRGYSIKGRTVRVVLSELDEAGLTEKVPGKGRRLTAKGRAELARGNVSGRLRQPRERIATVTSQVTYDPVEDVGEVAAASATIPDERLEDGFDALERLDDSPLAPVLVSVSEQEDGWYRLEFPASATLDGVLLANGIAVDLKTAGLVEYATEVADESSAIRAANESSATEIADDGGRIVRYVDTISRDGSTVDVVSLLVEAGRTNVSDVASSGTGLLVVDNREFPLAQYQEANDLSVAVRDQLGGVLDLRRPRASGPFPAGGPGWDFASLTYGGTGEIALALLAECDVAEDWTTLRGLAPRSEFSPLDVARTAFESPEARD